MSGATLVTGAAGFIGRALVRRLLDDGETVVATDLDPGSLEQNAERELDRSQLTLIAGDIGDSGLQTRCLENTSTVFHLAAAHLSVRTSDAEYRRVNVAAVQSLVERCESTGIERFVHLSSVGVFGRISVPPANEHTACHPGSIYERTKLEGERLVLDAALEREFPAVVLRPAWVYGPGDDRTEKLFRAIARRRFVIAGSGDTLRHSIFIDDMIEACLLARQSDKALGQVLIVGDREPITVEDLIGRIATLCGAPPPRRVPLSLLWLMGVGAELVFSVLGREPPLSRRTLRFFTGNTAFDTSRAERLLGFTPRYDLARGLQATFDRIDRGHIDRGHIDRSLDDHASRERET